mmetsp:Transcript_46224/g.147752  ORF Transcript_46224/g.147752 Transcript_46224/m.147752 type:complete len:261 (-) Transcript_46224:25-807(-)
MLPRAHCVPSSTDARLLAGPGRRTLHGGPTCWVAMPLHCRSPPKTERCSSTGPWKVAARSSASAPLSPSRAPRFRVRPCSHCAACCWHRTGWRRHGSLPLVCSKPGSLARERACGQPSGKSRPRRASRSARARTGGPAPRPGGASRARGWSPSAPSSGILCWQQWTEDPGAERRRGRLKGLGHGSRNWSLWPRRDPASRCVATSRTCKTKSSGRRTFRARSARRTVAARANRNPSSVGLWRGWIRSVLRHWIFSSSCTPA